MTPLEAKKVIDALANGIDPETGEMLPSQTPFNSPSVIRALFVAVKALENAAKRVERDTSLPGNAGRSWNEREDKALLSILMRVLPSRRLLESMPGRREPSRPDLFGWDE